VTGVIVSIRIDSVRAERTAQLPPSEELFFDVNAQLEEQKRSGNQVTLNFNLLITTKPNVVKYSTTGIVILEGAFADIQKKLEANPKTKIPQILFTVYQHVFNSIYILASILNTPYPPPDLLHPMAEKIQILPTTPQPQPQSPQPQPPQPQPEQAATPAQPTIAQPSTPVTQTQATPTAAPVTDDKTKPPAAPP
jgi:hypothetical protein